MNQEMIFDHFDFNYNDGGRSDSGYPDCTNKGDCAVRALSIGEGISYKKALLRISLTYEAYINFTFNKKLKDRLEEDMPCFLTGTVKGVEGNILRSYLRYSPNWEEVNLSDVSNEGSFLVLTSEHAFTIVDGVIQDIFHPKMSSVISIFKRKE